MYSSVKVHTHCSLLRIQETIPDPPAEATSAALLRPQAGSRPRRIDVYTDDTRAGKEGVDGSSPSEGFEIPPA